MYKHTSSELDSKKEALEIKEIDLKRVEHTIKLANIVNEHFSAPYVDSPQVYMTHKGITVNRPNHSLAHGLRQAFLAKDLAILIKNMDGLEKGSSIYQLQEWILKKEKEDKNFLNKIEFTNAFQRSGRGSEVSRGQDPKKYDLYLKNDQENFKKAAKSKGGLGEELFGNSSEDEINMFAEAITKRDSYPLTHPNFTTEISNDRILMSKLLFTAHELDLRRLPNFTKEKILNQIAHQIFEKEYNSLNEKELALIDKLWERSGDYLRATGDRDMEDVSRTDYNKDLFCSQAKNPEEMVKALETARTKPYETLLHSVTKHARVIRELKEKNKDDTVSPNTVYIHDNEQTKKIDDLRNTLKTSKYTASEGSLKLYLKDEFIEIGKDDSSDKIRAKIKINVEKFLENRFKLKRRSQAPDTEYVKTLIDCMVAERENMGKIVFYHATEPEIGFLYDVFTQFRHQLMMEGNDSIKALRAVDTAFLNLDADNKKGNVKTFMDKFNGVADSSTEYRDLMLSVNFSLFGSDQQEKADTYDMFYKVKDEQVVTQDLNYNTFFNFIMQQTNIPSDYNEFKKIFDKYIANNEKGERQRNGRMIQIFVDPDVLVDMAYFSVLMGAPVLKGEKGEEINPDLDEPIKILRTKPDKIEEYLSDTTGKILAGVPRGNTRPNKLELHDLQARLLMRPEVMFDPNLVTVNDYWRFGELKNKEEYVAEICNTVDDNLTSWLVEGAPLNSDTFAPETVKLKDVVQAVHKGLSGKKYESAPPASLEEQFLRILESGQVEKAASFIDQHYEAIKDSKFQKQADRTGENSGAFTLPELLMQNNYVCIYEIAFKKGIFINDDVFSEIFILPNSTPMQVIPGDISSIVWFLNSTDIDAKELLELYKKYFNPKHDSSDTLKVLKCLKYINNDEGLLSTVKPLLDFLVTKGYPVNSLIAVVTEIYRIDPMIREELVNLILEKSKNNPSHPLYQLPDFPKKPNEKDYDNLNKYETYALAFVRECLEVDKKISTAVSKAKFEYFNPYNKEQNSCPDKQELREAIVKHKFDIIKKKPFYFMDNKTGKSWHVSSINTPLGMDSIYLNNDVINKISRNDELILRYNTSNYSTTWGSAQFSKYHSGLNSIVMHFNEKSQPQSENIYDSRKPK